MSKTTRIAIFLLLAAIYVYAQSRITQFQTILLQPVKFSVLPSCSTANKGSIVSISDSTTVTWGATITVGGGTNLVLAYCDSSNWTVAGK